MTLDTLRSDLRALRVELAAARLTGVLRRWGAASADERKYDPHAVHQPAGTRIGGGASAASSRRRAVPRAVRCEGWRRRRPERRLQIHKQ